MTEAGLRRGVPLMLLATVLWPVLEFTGVSLMVRHHAVQVVFLRYAGHLLLLVPIVLARRGVGAFATRRPVLQLVRGLAMAGMPACYVLAADFASSGWIWSIFWSMPLLALIGAALLLGERVPRLAWVTAFVGVAGAALIRGAAGGSIVGSIIALAMGGTFATYVVLSRLLRDEPLTASLFYTAVGAFVPTALVVGKVWTPMLPQEYLPAIVVGALSIIILGVLDLALERGTVAALAPLLTLIPVWEVIVGAPVHGRVPDGWGVLGMTVIAAGVGVWWRFGQGRPRPQAVSAEGLTLEQPRVPARIPGGTK